MKVMLFEKTSRKEEARNENDDMEKNGVVNKLKEKFQKSRIDAKNENDKRELEVRKEKRLRLQKKYGEKETEKIKPKTKKPITLKILGLQKGLEKNPPKGCKFTSEIGMKWAPRGTSNKEEVCHPTDGTGITRMEMEPIRRENEDILGPNQTWD